MYQSKWLRNLHLVILLTTTLCASLLALDLDAVSGTWYRELEPGSTRFTNSHYRMELWSFSASGSSVQALRAQIYPQAEVRTLMHMGVLSLEPGVPLKASSDGSSASSRMVFDRVADARNLLSPQGFPVPTYYDIKGVRKENGSFAMTFAKTGQNSADTTGTTLVINGKTYRSLKADLIALGTGPQTQKNAEQFLRLFFLHIYSLESRIPAFGTISMVGVNEQVRGLIKGSLRMEFQSRGFLGLGNSGVMFTTELASEFPGLLVSGNVFGGVYRMEGIFNLFAETSKGILYLGSMDCTQVGLENGVAASGNFLVTLAGPSGSKRNFMVPYSVVGQ